MDDNFHITIRPAAQSLAYTHVSPCYLIFIRVTILHCCLYNFIFIILSQVFYTISDGATFF